MSTKERIGLLPETLVGLPRMKEYARHKGGSHCIAFTQNMLGRMKEVKRKKLWKNIGRTQRWGGSKTKPKRRCWLEKRTRGNTEECSKIKETFRRKWEDVWTRREKAWWRS